MPSVACQSLEGWRLLLMPPKKAPADGKAPAAPKAPATRVRKAKAAVTVAPEFDEEACRQRAYEISQSEHAGTPEENWVRAEQELRGA